MKLLFFCIISAAPFWVLASVESEACKTKENMRYKMNAVASNIANVNTTRTAEGGPYRTKKFVCVEQKCEIKETLKTLIKYEPGHLDADENGYVLYPDIDLKKEMETMTQASRVYDAAATICK